MVEQIKKHIFVIVDYDNHQSNDNTVATLTFPELSSLTKTFTLFHIDEQQILSYRQLFKSQNYVLLPMYNASNVMYACPISEMKNNVYAYLTNTNAYSLIEDFNESKNDTQRHLGNIVQEVNSILKHLLDQQNINETQYKQMNIGSYYVQMDCIDFALNLETVRFVSNSYSNTYCGCPH